MILDTPNITRSSFSSEEIILKQQLDHLHSSTRREIENTRSEYSSRISDINRMRDLHNSRMLEDIEYTQQRLDQERTQSFSLEQEISKLSLANSRELDSLTRKLSETIKEANQAKADIEYQRADEIKMLNEDIDFIQQDFERSYELQNRKFRVEIEELSDRREAQDKLIINLTQEVQELKRQLYIKEEETERIITSLARNVDALKNKLESDSRQLLKIKEDSNDAKCYSANMISEAGRFERMLTVEMDENAELKARYNKLTSLVYGKNMPKKRS